MPGNPGHGDALLLGLRFRGLGFRGLGFRGLGFRGLGFRGLGFRVALRVPFVRILLRVPLRVPLRALKGYHQGSIRIQVYSPVVTFCIFFLGSLRTTRQ